MSVEKRSGLNSPMAQGLAFVWVLGYCMVYGK